MLSDNDEQQGPPTQAPLLVLHEDYEPIPSYEDDIIPSPPIEFKSLFKAILEAPTGIPLARKKDTLNYMYYIVEKVYGPEYSP